MISQKHLQAVFLVILVMICVLGRADDHMHSAQQIEHPQLVLQTGHALGVNSIAFAPDGSWLVSAGADHSIIIWQTSSGRQLRALTGHKAYVRSVACSSDGRLIASGSNDFTVKVWDVDSARELYSLQKHSGPIVALAFSPDGRWLASGSVDKTIRIWDLKTGSEIKTLNKHTAPLSVLTFSKSGDVLVSAAGTEVISWETKTWTDKQTFRRNAATVTALAFGNDETTIASAASDGSVLLWRIGSDRERYVLKHNLAVALAIVFTNDSLMAIHSDGGIDTWDPERGIQKKSLPGDANRQQLAFAVCSRDGSIFASTTGDRMLSTRNSATGEVVQNFESHATAINSIAFSSDRRWFASAADDSSVRLWQVASGRELPRLVGHAGYVNTVAFSPDSNLLASGSRSGEVKIWDVNNGALAYSLPLQTTGVNNVAFSPTGKLLAVVGMDQKIEVWDLEKKQARTLAGHTAEITSVEFAGSLLVSAGRDKTIRTWSVETGAPVNSWETPSEINGIAVNRNADLVATANVDGTIRTWELKSGSLKNTFSGHAAQAWAVTFSPDGTSLASTSSDRTLIIWDLESPHRFQQLNAGIDKVNTVAYSTGGNWILTGSDDGTILVWETSTGQLTATLVSVPGSDDWLVTTPDGLFDGSPESWDLMLWRFEQGTFKVVPVESYFNEFYYPGVLAEIFAGQKPKAIEDIAQKDRRQPLITLKANADTTSRNINIEIALSAAAPDKDHPNDSGARDLRLFRNGLLVKTWTGDLLKNDKSVTIQSPVPIVAGENKFTAYAFNRDNIKSSDANLFVKGSESLKRQGTAYLLLIGVEQYENPEYNLRYSAADVSEMEAQLKAQQEKLGRYNPVVTVPLLNADATKANILLALERLSGTNAAPLHRGSPAVLARLKSAQPEDAVLVYFSGHGVAARNHFYLVPHDLGYKGPRKALNEAGLATILEHGVSDEELETALQPLDAGRLLLVIDACYSGQAIESAERRHGPMNTKGLAQLAYEKGIYILTASQNMEVAFEAEAFNNSYLAYALLKEGLKEGLADINNDGNIFLQEWFDYANKRVPQLRKQILKRKELVEEEADEQKVQRPRVFYTREEGAKTFLVGRRVQTN